MECTQRLECTQELYGAHTERTCPEQIGFLGICGAKHPVMKGPNKIGRDPQTCSIVLNLNSMSRQHAVINVLNSREYMLMDLDSANKTKLLNDGEQQNKSVSQHMHKTLQPYIPHPLRNGDTVQFGDIFGIFRLLEEDDELPMTQAIDIPETPAPSKHVSKLHKAPTTIVPESPDVSDRDESFLTPQSKGDKSRLSNSHYIKPFGKTISIHPVSSPNEHNRNSSKKSSSLSFVNNPNTSLNESFVSRDCNKNNAYNIHEMDTQPPNPIVNDSTDSIYTADTQVPPEPDNSPSIHNLNTQLPTTEHLPQVRKINDQHELQLDIYAANKENDLSIFNAETQPFVYDKKDISDKIIRSSNKSDETISASLKTGSKKNANKSEEELFFDEIDDCFEEDFNSQKILLDELPTDIETKKETGKSSTSASKRDKIIKSDSSTDCEDFDILPTQKIPELPTKNEKQHTNKNNQNVSKPAQRIARIRSDSSTDCEDIDIIPTQKIPELPINKVNSEEKINKKPNAAAKRVIRIQSDSSTDCEDMVPTQKIPEKKVDDDDDATDCEEEPIETTNKTNQVSKNATVTKFEDMPTQVIDVDHSKKERVPFEDMPTQIIDVDQYQPDSPKLEDMPTQIIDVDNVATNSKSIPFEDQPTQLIDEVILPHKELVKKAFDDEVSPFKIPLQSPIRVKSKDIPKLTPKDKFSKNKAKDKDDNYYNATQDIYDDLCSQRETSPELLKIRPDVDDEVVPCSVENYKVGEKFSNIENEIKSPTKRAYDENVTDYVTNLSSQQVRDVIGVDVTKLKRFPSDSSDLESTPKKVRPILFTDSDLPNSQEIKSSLTWQSKSAVTESSSESEMENYSEEITPFVHRKKKTKPVVKIDLTKKFEIEKLPERVLTRQRKPTSKLKDSTEIDKKLSTNMLRPTYLVEQEDQIDQDIITENIKRLKTFEKVKNNRDSNSEESAQDVKESTSQIKTEKKIKESKEKIKVKIEKPKRKESKPKKESTRKSEEIQSTKIKSEESKKESLDLRSTDNSIVQKNEKPKRNEPSKDTKPKRESARKREETNKDKSEINKSKESKSEEKSLDSTNASYTQTTRRTRAKKKENDDKSNKSKSVPPENQSNEPSNRRKRTIKKREKSKSPEVEIRRSKRQVKSKENVDDEPMRAPKSILKKSTHEQSTVYNVSSSSGEGQSLKRSLVDDSEVPSPKRTRSFVNNTSCNSINNASLRATPARVLKTQHVLFTAFPSDEVKQKLEKLGAVIVTDVLQCSVVLTMQVKRTFKLLCAVGLGRPIVGPAWVQACVDTHILVDPWLYLIKDEQAEKRFQFNLERTLTGRRNFLKGYNVSSTPSVQPNASEMKLIVESSGGTWKEGGSNWVCVSSTKDKALWPSLKKRGATVVSTEFILGGVLKQKLDITNNKFV